MIQNIYLLAFGTFGNPYGFRQTFFLGNQNIAKSIRTFDLNTNAIKLFENSILYSIRKESVNGLNTIAYSKYSFAKEKNSDRGGTFVGASILFTNEIAEDNLTITKLNEFHETLVSRNISDKTIMVNHSDDFQVDLPKDFDKLNFNLKRISEPYNFRLSNSNLVVYSHIDENTLQQNLKKSLELLNNFDTIFFTDNKEIVDFTLAKNLYRTTDENGFENEIQITREEKKKLRQLLIKDFEKEISELEENKKASIIKLKENIQRNSEIHQQNGKKIEESRKQVTTIENKYMAFSKKIKEAVNYLNSDKKIEEVKSFYDENKREFLNFINENSEPKSLSGLSSTQFKNVPSAHHLDAAFYQPDEDFQRKERTKKKSFKIYEFLSFTFFFFWILTLLYFLLFDTKIIPFQF
ncbi:MAG: hypothetical protein J7574_16000 [Flavobacterium sp.]|uniref:hypothetical protein n=1 Tax=Flavobacterium sp. TaxID=239 RepID=UPI001B1D074B|nr:hypothetical protein [Flavobacterium sp.]MBO9585669.1 hypothetical protein [Flavobacterium sp.]